MRSRGLTGENQTEESFEPRARGVCPSWGVGSRSPAAWSAREIELQALATLAALAQICTPSAAHFLKSHQLLVQKFAADRDRQRSSFESMGGQARHKFSSRARPGPCPCPPGGWNRPPEGQVASCAS